MPMTILLFVFLAVVVLNEIEVSLDSHGRVGWPSVFHFRVARKSTTMLVGFVLIFLLSAAEIYLFMSGKIYRDSIFYIPVTKALLIITLCFLAVAYKVILSQEKIVSDGRRIFHKKKMAIFLAASFLLCILLAVLLTNLGV